MSEKPKEKGSAKDLRERAAEENRRSSYGSDTGKNTGRKW